MYACISVFTYINMSITRGLQKVPDALMLFLGFTLGVFTSQSCVIRYVLMIGVRDMDSILQCAQNVE